MRRTTTAGWSRRFAPHRDPSPPATAARTALGVALALGALTGCTSPPAESVDDPASQPGETPAVAAPEVSAPVTRVAGRLPDRRRLALRRQVEELVAGYVVAAFADPTTPPRERFPGFTAGAARLARAQGAVLSRADLERSAPVTVEVVRVEAPVAVLAPRGRPSGATARLDLTLLVTPDGSGSPATSPTATAASERVRLQGRLLLTPVGTGWRVFGFDVRRSDR